MAQALEHGVVRGEVVTCGIVLFRGSEIRKKKYSFLAPCKRLHTHEMSAEFWIKAGRLSAQLQKKRALPFSDLLIATLALEHDLSVLTIDTHFDLIAGLKLTQG